MRPGWGGPVTPAYTGDGRGSTTSAKDHHDDLNDLGPVSKSPLLYRNPGRPGCLGRHRPRRRGQPGGSQPAPICRHHGWHARPPRRGDAKPSLCGTARGGQPHRRLIHPSCRVGGVTVVVVRPGDRQRLAAAQAILNRYLGAGLYSAEKLSGIAADAEAMLATWDEGEVSGAAVARLLHPD